MKRFVEEELLDSNAGTPEEVQLSLDDLRGVNRRFGGNALHTRLFAKAVSATTGPLTILEVASGRADVLQAALLPLRKQGRELSIWLLDASRLHFPCTELWDSALPKPQCFEGNALDLPFQDNSADIVSCCLFLHHLEPDQITAFFREALRVARTAVIINDLERRPDHWLLACMGRFVFRSRLSKYDSKVSVRRSYTLEELRNLLSATGHPFELFRHRCFRLGGILWKHNPDGEKRDQRDVENRAPEDRGQNAHAAN